MSPLENRFVEFVRSLKNSEIVDEIELSLKQKKAKKPDFFFGDRQFIGEMKSLKENTEYKALDIIDLQKERPEFPVFYEPWEVSKVLNCLPDGEYINQKIIRVITSGLKKSLKKANKQIKSSKTTYEIDDAEGILIVINDLVEILSPEVIAYAVHQLLQPKKPSGELLCPDIAVVLIVGGLHTLRIEQGRDVMPIVTIVNSYIAEYKAAKEYTRWLERKWAEFNNMPFIDANIRFEDFKTSALRETQPPKQFTRSEVWKDQYKENPHLRGLAEDELISYGQKLLYETMPFYFEGEHDKLSQERVNELLELNTHLMEEFNYRGLDFRKFGSAMQEAVKQLKEEGKVGIPSQD